MGICFMVLYRFQPLERPIIIVNDMLKLLQLGPRVYEILRGVSGVIFFGNEWLLQCLEQDITRGYKEMSPILADQ